MGFQGYIYIGCRSGSIYKQKRWCCRNRFTLFTTLSLGHPGFFVCGRIGRFGLTMKKVLPLLIFTTLALGQDTLETASGQILIGDFIKSADKHIIFQEKNEAEPLSILKEDVGKIMISEGVISKKEKELKESKFNWYSVPCLFLVAVISMLTLISQDGFPGFP